MKKKIITIAAIGSFVLLTAAYTFFSTEKNQVNSLMLENIEALASSEENVSTKTGIATTSKCGLCEYNVTLYQGASDACTEKLYPQHDSR